MWQWYTQLFASSYTWLAYIFEASCSTVVASVSKKSSVDQSELEKWVVSHCQTYYMYHMISRFRIYTQVRPTLNSVWNFYFYTPPEILIYSVIPTFIDYNDIVTGSYDLFKRIHQSLIQCLDCRFIVAKFLLFKENTRNDFIHGNLPMRTFFKKQKIRISFMNITNIPVCM